MSSIKVKVRYWKNGPWFGWIHHKGTPDETLELSLHSRLRLIRTNK